MTELSDADVEGFASFTATDAQTARLWLRRYNGDIERAVSEYWDKGGVLPPESQQDVIKWDENFFAADRDVPFGPANRNEPGSLQIMGDDVPSTQLRRNTPEIDEWRSGVQHDSKFSRDQQSGVTGAGGDQPWSITRPPDATYRRRKTDGSPAVIRPQSKDLLAPLLSVLHNIPRAREALLGRQALRSDYNSGQDWWNGQPTEDEDEDSESGSQFWAWTQRLMAFLDGTTRGYASIAGLEDAMRKQNAGTNRESMFVDQAFLDMHSQFAIENFPDLATSRIFQTLMQLPKDDREDAIILSDLYLDYDAAVADTGGSILDIIDEQFVQNAEGGKSAYLTQGADVLVVFLVPSSDDKPLNIKIPHMFHSGHWFSGQLSSDTMTEMRKKQAVQQKLRDIDQRCAGINETTSTNTGSAVSTTGALQDSIRYLKERHAAGQLTDSKDEGDHNSETAASDTALQTVEEIYTSLGEKLPRMEQEKNNALMQIKEISNKMSELRSERGRQQAGQGKGSNYNLRGVALSPSRFYVQTSKSDPGDLLTDNEWQWWSIDAKWDGPAGWTNSESFKLDTEISSASDAVSAAERSTTKIMLVYATNAAISDPVEPLPEPLQSFLNADNAAFEKECSPWAGNSPSSTIAEQSRRPSSDIQMSEATAQEGMIRLTSREDSPARGHSSWRDLKDSFKSQPPKLPPRQAGSSRPVTPSGGKRKTMLSGIKHALSRSKSRERSRDRAGHDDLLIDNEEQTHGIPAMPSDAATVATKTSTGSGRAGGGGDISDRDNGASGSSSGASSKRK